MIDEYRELKEMIYSTGGTDYGTERVMSSARQSGGYEDKVIRLVDTERDIGTEIKKLTEERRKIKEAVQGIEDEKIRTAMTLYYIGGYDLFNTAAELGVTEKEAKRYLKEGVETVQEGRAK